MILFTTIFGYCASFISIFAILFLVLLRRVVGHERLFDRSIKLICRCVPLYFGIRVCVRGAKNIDPKQPYIFMANHVNIFDPIILYGHIPNFLRAVELEDHFSWPVWGTIIRHAGMIPISHRHIGRAIESLQNVALVVKQGISVLILPEGHRTRDGNLGAFMRGPFRLALEAGADIVPIALKNLFERKSVHSPRVRPGNVEVVIGKPIAHTFISQRNERELRDSVMEEMQLLLE